MEQVSSDNIFNDCWDAFNSSTPQLVPEILKRVTSLQRLEILKRRKTAGDVIFAFDKVNLLQKSIIAMNAGDENAFSDEDNLLIAMLKQVEPEDKLSMLLTMTETDCNTALSMAAMYGDTATARCILDPLPKQDRLTLLKSQNWLMETPLHHAALWAKEAVVLQMLDSLSLTDQLGLMAMEAEGNERQNILHYSVFNDQDDYVVLSLLQYLNKKDGKMCETKGAIERILLSSDANGNTFLHCCAEAGTEIKVRNIVSKDGLTTQQFITIMQTTNHKGMTPLHYAGKNRLKDDCVLLALLQALAQICDQYPKEVKEILFCQDNLGETVLHKAAILGTLEQVKQITEFPRHMIQRLPELTDHKGRVPRDVAAEPLKADYIDQIGSYSTDFYPLETPPQILIFYSTRDRQTHYGSSDETDAEAEKNCIVRYVKQKGIEYILKRDPTKHDVMSTIEEAKRGDSVSGLIVFWMSHGLKGIVEVEGPEEEDNFMYVNDIINHMHLDFEDKPKVLFLQACQSPWELPSPATSNDIQEKRHQTEAPTDLLPTGNRMQQANLEGIQVNCNHCLVFQASASGLEASRNVMVPELISSLAQLEPHDCIEDAVKATKNRLMHLVPGQTPTMISTLCKKICIGKNFQSINSCSTTSIS